MSDQSESVPQQGDLTEERVEFLRRVFGYERLPTHWELCQLAAMVGGNEPGIDISGPETEAEKRVELAMALWRSAALEIEKEKERREPAERRFTERMPLYGALKVGNHLLPKIVDLTPDFTPSDDSDRQTISLARFEEIVIGLSKAEQRRPWWRAYMEAKVKSDKHKRMWGQSPRSQEKAKQDLDWCEPDDMTLEDGLIDGIIAHQREKGIEPGFSVSTYLEGFRIWRLTMKTPHQRAKTPYLLEDCVKKSLGESENSNF